MVKNYKIHTELRDVYSITEQVRETVAESGVAEGTCIVFTPHTTAGLAVTSRMDPAGFEDLQDEICRLVPTKIDFKHQFDTPSDAAGHIKSSLVGVSLPFLVTGGKLLLGGSQGIYFLEFDGPRNREYFVKVTAD